MSCDQFISIDAHFSRYPPINVCIYHQSCFVSQISGLVAYRVIPYKTLSILPLQQAEKILFYF